MTSEGIQSIKVVCEYICCILDQKGHGSSILVEANLHLADKLQPDPNYLSDTISHLNFKKVIKIEIEIEFKFLLHATVAIAKTEN